MFNVWKNNLLKVSCNKEVRNSSSNCKGELYICKCFIFFTFCECDRLFYVAIKCAIAICFSAYLNLRWVVCKFVSFVNTLFMHNTIFCQNSDFLMPILSFYTTKILLTSFKVTEMVSLTSGGNHNESKIITMWSFFKMCMKIFAGGIIIISYILNGCNWKWKMNCIT